MSPTIEVSEGGEDSVYVPDLSEQNVVFKPNPGPQTLFLAAPEREVLYGGPLQDSTLVITSEGRKPIKDIAIGDLVLTPKGTFTKVIDIPFVGEEESYKLTFSNGAEVIASAGHEWHVSTADWAKTSAPYRTKRTNELLDYKLSRNRNKYRLPNVAPHEYSEKSHYISPYILGVLLADGCVTKSINIFTADAEVVDRVREELHEDYELVFRCGMAYSIVKTNRKKAGTVNEYKEELKRLGVFGHNAFTKFIPDSYLLDSIENRHSVLQGLMDSDGTCRNIKHGRDCAEAKYTTVSERLKDTFIALAESLGFNTSMHTEVLETGSLAYRITLGAGGFNPFYLSRKALQYSQFTTRQNKVMITSIESVGVQQVRCITVEDKDSLFVLDRNITTHNCAGGGKSYAMLADPMRYMGHPQFSGLLLRHTTEELRELIWKSQEMYPKIYPGIKWSERKMQWVAPSGARLWFSYLDRDEDVLRYQGLSFSWVGFDELTQWHTPFAWNYMRSRLRSTAPDLPICMRATTNPGGPGHAWVKKMFIDPAPFGKSFWATDIETGETLKYPKGHSKEGSPLFKRRFIPAKLSDNPYLAEQGDYETMLLSLPEHQRKQLLEGNWDVSEGAAFPEFNRQIHVIDPMDIPKSWVKFRSCDYGYGSYSAVLWFAVTPSEQLIVYRELYVSKVLARDLANMVLELEQNDGTMRYGVLDSSCWHKRGDTGPSLAEQMIQQGCRWKPSDRSAGSRVSGKNEIHRRLQVDEFTEEPRLVITSNCTNLIAQLPIIPLDKHNPEDIDTKSEDHLYDALRYGIMSRPRSNLWDYNPLHQTSGMKLADPTFGY